nr:TetR/AcrR family transcriptional regulator [Kineosporia mesophila]
MEAARAQIMERGSELSMDDIARSARVAVGTLYRHFPTKTDLVAATLDVYLIEVAEAMENVLAQPVSGKLAAAGFRDLWFGFLESTSDQFVFKEAAQQLGIDPHGSENQKRTTAALTALLVAGQESGQIRPGIVADDIYLLMSTMPAGRPAPERHRWAELVLPAIMRT